MKDKTVGVFLGIVISLLCFLTISATTNSSEVGRYQIFVYDNQVYILDTATAAITRFGSRQEKPASEIREILDNKK